MSDDLPIIAGTLQTDPRSGGLKRSSGVNVLPIVSEAWNEVRDDSNDEVDWIIAGYVEGSKTDITILVKGHGGVEACSAALPQGIPVFGGIRVRGRFVTFYYAKDDDTSTMQKGRASMHKNGVLNVLEGSDCEIEMERGMTEEGISVGGGGGGGAPQSFSGTQQQPVSKPPPPASGATAASIETATKSVEELDMNDALISPPESSSSSPAESSPAKKIAEGDEEQSSTSFIVLSYEELKSTPAALLPTGVDPAQREQSLSEDEFERIFGMTQTEFRALAAWKRSNLKKKHGLF